MGDTDADKKFVFKLPIGLYLVTIDATTEGNETITFTKWETNSVYEIGNLGQLKFFADRLNTDGVSLNAKLTADIGSAEGDKMDYAIGWHNDSDHKWYSGEFDGNYHTIYLNIDKQGDDNQGLFGAITGGAYIHDVTVAGSVKGHSYIAGVVGSVRCNSGGGGEVNITNCKNTATITSYNKEGSGATNAGGIVGVTMNNGGYCKTNISYCCNTGNVYGKSDSGLISGWIGNGSIKHTFASGTLEGPQSNREFSRYQTCDFYANVTMTGSSDTGGAYYFNPSPSDGTYTINNVDEFLCIATMVNVGGLNTKNFNLAADIDASEKEFTPIGTSTYNYTGTFDGQSHSVKLNLSKTEDNIGLIAYAGGGATIQNLVVKGSVSGKAYVGGVVGVAYGSGTLTFSKCGNEADVTGTGVNVGGLLGCNFSSNVSVHMTNCYNTGAISGSNESAGISGWLGNNAQVTNTYNSGDVTGIDGSNRSFVRWGSGTYTNCYNKLNAGNFTGRTDNYPMDKVRSGELCVALGNAFTQDLSQEGHPTFGSKTVTAGKWFNDTNNDVYYNLENDNYTVYQLNMSDTNTKYEVPANVTAKNVSIARTIPSGQWIGLCLPFALETIPSGWDVRELTSVTGYGETASMKFSSASTIEAGKPYIVKPDAEVPSITATDKEIATAASTVSNGGVNMIGNFAQTSISQGNFYINTSSQLKKLSVASVNLKGFRAYFTAESSGGVKALSFDFDDDATGISLMEDGRSQMEDGAIYNVAGQRLNKMQKGINIVNGKKILK